MTVHVWNPPTSGTVLAVHVDGNVGPVSNDTDTPFSALTGVTPVLPAGNYRVALSYMWNKGIGPASDFIANLVLDGASVTAWGGDMHRMQPVTSAGNDVAGTQTDQSTPVTSLFDVTYATAGAHTYDFAFHTEFAGERVSVHNLTLAFTQIS